MTMAYWTVLVAILIPWLMAVVKKSPLVRRGEYNNNAPRADSLGLGSESQRAHWAEQNSYEILPGYIAAVMVAHFAGAEQRCIDAIALAFIASRIVYCLCYLKDWAMLRSIVWLAGLLCIVGLFVISAL